MRFLMTSCSCAARLPPLSARLCHVPLALLQEISSKTMHSLSVFEMQGSLSDYCQHAQKCRWSQHKTLARSESFHHSCNSSTQWHATWCRGRHSQSRLSLGQKTEMSKHKHGNKIKPGHCFESLNLRNTCG